ncbi:fibronectin type III domain-containing protein [Bacillus sp. N9]
MVKKFNDPNVPLWDFNSNYEVHLTPEQVFEVKLTTAAQGLHDSALRQVGIANADGETISTAVYNDGQVDGITNKSVIYQKGVTKQMIKMRNNELATPGLLIHGQIPGPEAPDEIETIPMSEAIALNWNPSDEAASYTIYHPNHSELFSIISETSFTLENLINNQHYFFWITAVDKDGNESQEASLFILYHRKLLILKPRCPYWS